jgi:hypothetical protein
METPSIAVIKTELNGLGKSELINICLRLARFKKENKELMAYLLFNQFQKQDFVNQVNEIVTESMQSVNKNSAYLAKKTVRKVLRLVNKFCRYAGDKEVEVQLYLHFCASFLQLPPATKRYPVLGKLYVLQVKKLEQTIEELHEDLQYDYLRQLKQLG